MILRYVCWSIFLCLTLRSTVKAQVEVNENGYQDVLISFSPNVPSENGQEFVKTIEELLVSTSSILHKAIGIRIASATFLLPTSWSTETWKDTTIKNATSKQAEKKPDIRIDATEENPFGKQPVTLQHGGCGVPGYQINLPVDFLSSTDNYPRGKLLAREWLKYQYGVFEENGFQDDDLYPNFYRIPGSSDIRITECTNSKVKYTFKKSNQDEECTMDTTSEFQDCRPYPDEESAANVTSSLMYFHHDLQNMEHICGKDEQPHHDSTLSKQNILCNGRSIWDVIKLSKDFNITSEEPTDPSTEAIQFSYVQSKPRFVVVVENSDKLLKLASSIQFALKRFYYDLPPKSLLAIHTFDTVPTVERPLSELPAEGRNDLTITLDHQSPPNDICTSCGLISAIEALMDDDTEAKGSILLITASALDEVPEIAENFKENGISLSVLQFVGAEDPVDDSYDGLRSKFGHFEYDKIEDSLDLVSIYGSLFTFLTKPIPHFKDGFEIKAVVQGLISGQIPVTIPQDPTASLYTLWMNKNLASKSIQCKAGENTPVPLTDGIKGADIASFTFKPVEDNDITCELLSKIQTALVSQVQMTTIKGHYFEFDTWIHDESTDTEQLPIIIYAKIYFGGYPVKDANVTAVVAKLEEEMGSTAENKSDALLPMELKLLDNGGGDPDVTRYDGVYSGYFTGFESAGKYEISVKIDDNEGKVKFGKLGKEDSLTCCGSEVFSEDGDVPAFQMEKLTTYEAKNKMPDDGYPPSRIVNLRVSVFEPNYTILTWTAPAGAKASSYEFYAFCELEDCKDGRLPNWLKLNQTEIKPRSYGELEEVIILFSPDIPKVGTLTMFFAIKSANEKGKLSDMSNKVEILLSLSEEPSSTTDTITDRDRSKIATSDTIGIIVGGIIIGILILLCIGALLYFYVFKPRRTKSSNIDISGYFQDKNQNDTEVSGSFKAVPIRQRGSMRRVESFPVLLYTHDQLKDFKKKVDPPLYKPSIAPRPWMSMNVLSSSEQNRSGDSKSVGSASTLPMNDKHRSTEMEQLDDVSLASETNHPEETIKV